MVDVMKDATRDLVTKKDLRAELNDLRAEFYRAMLIQAGIVLTGVAAIAAIATLLARLG